MKALIACSLLVAWSVALFAAPAKPPAEAPLRVGGKVTRPEKIAGNPPVYPEAARKAKVRGTVILEAIIEKSGDVTEPRVLKGLPMGLDKAAIDAVTTWKYKPATLEGKPVRVYFTVVVPFNGES